MRRLLLLVGLTVLGALLFASLALAQDPCPDPNFPRETPDGCQASDLPDVSFGTASSTATSTASATLTATSTPSATATASSTATASAAAAAGGSLPTTGGPTYSPLMGMGAFILLAGAGVMSVRTVRRRF